MLNRPTELWSRRFFPRSVSTVAQLALVALFLYSSPSPTFAQQSSSEFGFTFDSDSKGWLTGFADLPAGYDQGIYELESSHRELPEELTGNGIFIQGHNRSDDLFMFLSRQVDGLEPGTAYRVTISVDVATNVPVASFGIGGSPGESVYVKAGATTIEPAIERDGQDWLRMTIDKGNQASEGEDMINLGNVAHPDVAGTEYRIKTLNNEERPFDVTADEGGRLWLIVGTDSGFEGLTSLYYTGIKYTFDPVVEPPVVPPKVGDYAFPGWSLVISTVLGTSLMLLGLRLWTKRSTRPPVR